jgi:hypothetical protein
MYLNINFNEEFEYVANSLQIKQIDGEEAIPVPILVTPDPFNPATLDISGSVEGDDGFTLPTGIMEIKFTLKAPDFNNLQDELDDNNQPTGKKMDLDIMYDFTSTMDNSCAIAAIEELQGNKLIPYSEGKTHIISNKNVTTKIAR